MLRPGGPAPQPARGPAHGPARPPQSSLADAPQLGRLLPSS